MRIIEAVCDIWHNVIYTWVVFLFEFATNKDCKHCKNRKSTIFRDNACEYRYKCEATIKKPYFDRERWI